MSRTVKAKSTKSREKIAEIQRTLSGMEYLSSGTLLKRMKVCGNPRCHCASDPAARHGPYFEWSYLKAGKLHHRTLTPEQAEIMQLAIANQRESQETNARLGGSDPGPNRTHDAEIALKPPMQAVITRKCVRRCAECKTGMDLPRFSGQVILLLADRI